MQDVWWDHYPEAHWPAVRDGRGSSAARADASVILLPKWSRITAVVLHETAHSLIKYNGTDDHHGPRFVRQFINLVVRYDNGGLTERELLASAKKYKIKVEGM